MKLTFKLTAELTVTDLELNELECVHSHGHEEHGDKHCHHHGDDNMLGSLKGSASLKFDADLAFDMQPEEMKTCYSMVESLGGKFAEVAHKTKDLGERVVAKINQTEGEKPKSTTEAKPEDQASVEIEFKAELKKASDLISEEESKTEPEIEQLDWARSKLDNCTCILRRAQHNYVEIDNELVSEYTALRLRLRDLNDKC